jgi:TPR repeat protein
MTIPGRGVRDGMPTPSSPLIIALLTVASFLIGFSIHEFSWHISLKPQHGNLQVAERAFQSGDDQSALALFAQLARRNDPEAEYWLGHMTELGLGVPRDPKKAIDLYRKAATQNVIAAELRLGEIYLHGDVVPPDFAQAKRYLEQAAYHGDAHAAMLLGQMYGNALGVPPDPKEAYVWSEVASIEGGTLANRQRDASLENLDVNEQKAAIAQANGILTQINQRASSTPAQKSS